MEERERDAHEFLKTVLHVPQPGALGVVDLIKELVLTEGKRRDERNSAEGGWGNRVTHPAE